MLYIVFFIFIILIDEISSFSRSHIVSSLVGKIIFCVIIGSNLIDTRYDMSWTSLVLSYHFVNVRKMQPKLSILFFLLLARMYYYQTLVN